MSSRTRLSGTGARVARFATLIILAGLCAGMSSAARSQATTPAASRLQARALVVPRFQATIASEISGRIVSMPLDVGAVFRKGDLLLAFDCRTPRAQLDNARALFSHAEATLQAKVRLARLQSASKLDVALAKAEAERADAAVQEARIAISRCRILAPYDGRVAKRHVNPFESVTYGKPLLDIIGSRSLRVQLIVPSKWLRWMKPGTPFDVAVDETGRTYAAKLSIIGARVDPASQSIEVLGEFGGATPDLLAGMSGAALFRAP